MKTVLDVKYLAFAEQGFEYLASPYSHKDPDVMQTRFWCAVETSAELIRDGRNIFSPIAHSHEMGLILGDSCNHDLWLRVDLAMLAKAKKLVVLRLEGWEQSFGVQQEIALAEALHIPIEYIDL